MTELRQEKFSFPLVPPDPSDIFDHESPRTVGPTVETIVEYGCLPGQEPRVHQPVEISGINDVTFIVGSKYKVEVFVNKYKRIRCEMPDCQNAFKYEVQLKYYFWLKGHIDVGIVAGYLLAFTRIEVMSRRWEEFRDFTTSCFCCDE